MSHPILFLGAGASVASGMPTTPSLTRELLSGTGFVRRTWDRYELGVGVGPDPTAEVIAITEFLRTVQALTRLTSAATYEDIQYVLTQLEDDLLGDYDNPALKPLWEKILDHRGPLTNERLIWDIDDFVAQSAKYLADGAAAMIVAAEGSRAVSPLAAEAAEATTDGMVTDIVTLNYDSVVERTLADAGRRYSDGFRQDVLGVWSWRPGLIDSAKGVRLLKLHGSVTWRRESEKEGRLVRIDPHADRTPSGTRVGAEYEILTGTHNKILQYARAHFGDLHSAFRVSLRRADCLVVAGYGFRDKAINTIFIEWMADRAHRIVIVHPDPERLRAGCRPAVSRAWNNWETTDRVGIVSKPAEHASWDECRELAGGA